MSAFGTLAAIAGLARIGLVLAAQTKDEMQTAPAATMQHDRLSVNVGEAFLIAERDANPTEGVFVYPDLLQADGKLFLNWHFDFDVLDREMPTEPNGRVSDDGGRTWKRQTVPMPPGSKFATGAREITAFWDAFEIAGEPGCYRVATWRSSDGGGTWGEMSWTKVRYPGTRGLDIYDPPEAYKKHSANYKLGQQRPKPPAYLEEMFTKAGSRRRGPGCSPVVTYGGAMYSMTCGRWSPTSKPDQKLEEFYEKVDWERLAVWMQSSKDGGRTWEFRGVVAFDKDHKITDLDEEDCFSEPTLTILPDGEMICIMRVGSFKPLYLVRSKDDGRTWTQPQALPIRGVLPKLALLPDGVLVLSTGRPDCTIHFSLDRGGSWPLNQTLFTVGKRGKGYLGYQRSSKDRFDGSTCNVQMVIVEPGKLLYVHDAVRADPDSANWWLKEYGHGRMIGRFITTKMSDGK